jgi:2-keto-4-pentenoate hydratase/2-oxohepta-3-ene-1,7-dioic acid hydratase in catechol pathway/regulator of RNase E activity RraA
MISDTLIHEGAMSMTVTPLQADFEPGKIIALHLNYPSRIAQRGRTPAFPSFFLKPITSLATSGSNVERPAGCELLAFEGEIALIIGTRARRVTPNEGWAAVAAITAANDFGVYDLRYVDKGSNLRSKGGDGFTPIGPNVIDARAVDQHKIRIRTWVNGKLAQDDTTEALTFSFGTIVADVSQLITLEPGDVILTGTPAGSSVVVPGDTLEVEVDAPSAKGKPTTGRLVSHITQGAHELPSFSAGPKVDDLQREEAWGSREAAGMPASILTPELKKKINSVSTATMSSVLRKKGFNNVSIDGLQSTRPGKRMLGLARTLRYIANREDLFEKFGGGFNAQKRAIESVGPDEVLVMEARGEKGTGTVGDILAIRAQLRGCEGIVTDGGVRDVAAVSALDMPTYFANPHPAVLGRRHVPWDTDITITCGGCAVQPGDVIVGDADGVLVIPPHLINDVVDAAIVQEAEEEFILAMVKKGEKVDTLYPMDAEWKKRFEVWRKGKK